MRTCYVDPDTYSIADLIHPGELTDGWTISRINVPARNRGKGLGTMMLKHIIADADAEGVDLWLEVSPSDGLGRLELERWYIRHGFKFHRATGYMVRRHQS